MSGENIQPDVRCDLCVNDPRNPKFENSGACYRAGLCDNCVYGRHELAVEVLRLRGRLREIIERISKADTGGIF